MPEAVQHLVKSFMTEEVIITAVAELMASSNLTRRTSGHLDYASGIRPASVAMCSPKTSSSPFYPRHTRGYKANHPEQYGRVGTSVL